MRARLSLLDRFFQVLVEEIREHAPDYLDSSFTVAEIYQSLVPYRTHRDRIGAEMNGDYEDALLRLLAGEGDYLEMDSDTARERVRLELRSSNPNTGLYREFAAVRVRLNSDLASEVPEKEEGDEPSSQTDLGVDDTGDPLDLDDPDDPVGTTLNASEEEMEGEDVAGAEGPGTDPPPSAGTTKETTMSYDRLLAHPGQDTEGRASPDPEGSKSRMNDKKSSGSGAPEAATAPDDDVPAECPECDRTLPGRGNLQFCPFCGANVFVVPCESCGEELERSWSYCIACGVATG